MGVSTQAFGTLCQWLVQLINLVTGNLDRVGGALCTSPALDLVASTSGGHFDRWRSRVSGLPEYGGELPVAALAEEILGEGEGQVRALVTVAGNPVLSTPNGRRLEQALDGLEFMLSIDLYINETTRYADLILPPTAPLEHDHYDTTFNVFAVRNVTRFNEAVLPRPEGALHDWEIFVGLARAFAARNGLELKPTLEPQQMIDLGLRWRLRRPFRAQAEPGHSARTSPRHRPRAAAAEPGAAPEDRRPAHPGRAAAVRRRPATLRRTATACVRPVAADRTTPRAQQQFLDAQLPSPGEGQAASPVADAPARSGGSRPGRRAAGAGALAGRQRRGGGGGEQRDDARGGQPAARLGPRAARRNWRSPAPRPAPAPTT